MSDILYTPPASGGGGTTINPTNNFIPVRSNATTFIDSLLFGLSDVIKTRYLGNDNGLLVDFGQGAYFLGDFNQTQLGSCVQVDATSGGISLNVDFTTNTFFFNLTNYNKTIQSYFNGYIGLKLNFNNDVYSLGDYNSVSSGTSFLINVANSTIYTQHSGQQEGLFFDFVNDYFQIGDFGTTNNGTYITIDDDNQFIASYTNGNLKGLRLDFLNDQFALGDYNGLSNGNYIIVDNTGTNEVVICANKQLNIKGVAIQVGANYTYALENLQIKAPDGNIYYIPLYN